MLSALVLYTVRCDFECLLDLNEKIFLLFLSLVALAWSVVAVLRVRVEPSSPTFAPTPQPPLEEFWGWYLKSDLISSTVPVLWRILRWF